MGDIKDCILKFAWEHPIKFTAILTFTALGAIPITSFLSFSVVTMIMSLVGAVMVELFLLVVGVSALVFVLIFVGCATLCVTAMFMLVYYTYTAAANSTWKRKRSPGFGSSLWSSSSRYHPPDPTRLSEQNDDDDTFDKSKFSGPLEIGHMSQTFVSSFSTDSAPHKSHDFLRTALITLFLVSAIFVMSLCVMFFAYLVISYA